MTNQEIKERLEAIRARRAELDAASQETGADLDAIIAELNELNNEQDQLTDEAEQVEAQEEEARKMEANRREIRSLIAAGMAGKATLERVNKKAGDVRNSKAYIEAYANYIKTGRPDECRALLTETVSGTVPVPALVDDIIRHAWEEDEIMSRVRKTEFRGNLKVAFERSADPAYVHTEGQTAHTEEALQLGIVTMIPRNIKKYIRISDEALAMGGEAFLRYIYEEITYQIVKKLAALIVTAIAALDTSNGATAVAAAKITQQPGLTTIAEAFANLSDEATDPVIIMNKLTYANFMAAYAAGNFAVDPFMGLKVCYSSALAAYDTASDNAVYCIVGDLKGAQVNYPEGEGVIMKMDDLSESEKDLVKVVGRQYAAYGVTAPFRFTNIAKPAAATT